MLHSAVTYTAADLAMVDRHIAQGERHVAQQQELVERLREHGLPIEQAEILLADFKSLLAQHREHRQRMLDDIGRRLA